MSLDWSVAKVKDKDRILSEDAMVESADGTKRSEWTITEAVIFECMVVDMNGITEKNAAEFFARSDFFRSLHGSTDFRFTPQMIADRIGLNTNVATKSWAYFAKRHADSFRRDALRRYQRKVNGD